MAVTDGYQNGLRRGLQRTIGFPFELHLSSRLSGGGPIRATCAREHVCNRVKLKSNLLQ